MKFARLEQWARGEVDELKRRLPPEMVDAAAAVPVVWMPRPTPEMIREDGLEPDLLGLYVGPTCAEGLDGADPLPPEILIFLENIWEYAEYDEKVFREEVRVTYFHELGHYIGLEEDALEARGLE